jgi:alanyl-tRNA synthetase
MTTTITAPTDPEIRAAERELANAGDQLAKARSVFAQKRYQLQSETRTAASQSLSQALERRNLAEAALAALREARGRAQQLENRRALEKKSSKDLKQRADDLTARRDQVVAAMAAAQDGLVAALAVIEDYNAALAEQAGELAAQGFDGIADEYTAGSDPRARVVRLGGQDWQEIDPEVSLAQLVERVRLARLYPTGFEIAVRRFAWGGRVSAAAAALLAMVPRPQLAERSYLRGPSWTRRAR